MLFLRPGLCEFLAGLLWAWMPPVCDFSPPRYVVFPAFTQNPNPRAPLAAIVTFTTNEPAVVGIEINHDGEIHLAGPELTTEHSVPVLGLRAGAVNTVRVFLSDAAGNSTVSPPAYIQTDPLPEDFPPIEIRAGDAQGMEPGVTFFNPSRFGAGTIGLLAAVNARGEVIWHYRADGPTSDARQMANGNILFLDAAGAVEIDLLGNVVQRWHPTGPEGQAERAGSIPVRTTTFHHEIAELPWGNLLTLSTELRRIQQYPSSETDPDAPLRDSNVVGDLIVEFARDGTIVRQWSLLDVLDPYRIGYDSLGGSWNALYRGYFEQTRDWAHANAVVYDASDDSFIVSSRHQDAVFRMSRATGELMWILGNPDGWRWPWNQHLLQPDGTVEWPFHQHAPLVTPRGTILMFDNGNFRARPFERKRPAAESFSRAVEYSVNSETMTVSQVWSYGGPADELYYSSMLGYAQPLPLTGNVLITDGARRTDAVGNPSDSNVGTSRWARIVEVTRTTPGRKVFELIVGNPAQPLNAGWSVYRSRRLRSLYPY